MSVVSEVSRRKLFMPETEMAEVPVRIPPVDVSLEGQMTPETTPVVVPLALTVKELTGGLEADGICQTTCSTGTPVPSAEV